MIFAADHISLCFSKKNKFFHAYDHHIDRFQMKSARCSLVQTAILSPREFA